MARVCVINVVGLTPQLLKHAPRLSALGQPVAWKSPLPAVTSTSQATLLTGLAPRDHGIVDGEVAAEGLAGALGMHRQAHAFHRLDLAGEHSLQGVELLLGCDLRQEAEPAQVHAQDRNHAPSHLARHGQQRAVQRRRLFLPGPPFPAAVTG